MIFTFDYGINKSIKSFIVVRGVLNTPFINSTATMRKFEKIYFLCNESKYFVSHLVLKYFSFKCFKF